MEAAAKNAHHAAELFVLTSRIDSISDSHPLIQLSPPLSSPSTLHQAQHLIANHQWHQAARLLGRILDRDHHTERLYCLARNLAALQHSRPHLYANLITQALPHHLPDGTSAYQIQPSRTGEPTLAPRNPSCPTTDTDSPLLATERALHQITSAPGLKPATGLMGIGDGSVLEDLSRESPGTIGETRCIWIVEPDPQRLWTCLMIHNFSAPQGPIDNPRFIWIVGQDWISQIQHALAHDDFLPLPEVIAIQNMDTTLVKQGLIEAARPTLLADAQCQLQLREHYRKVARNDLADICRANSHRPRRILFITSRFTTVLQHSTADTAHAFEKMGWQVRILKEPFAHYRHSSIKIRRIIHQFQPHIVFNIDHLRCEQPESFPPGLLCICWIQDHLPNLANPSIGPEITPDDFILTAVSPKYIHQYAYPPEQCIDLPKLTRIPDRPATSQPPSEDLVYVSNASQIPEQLAQNLIRKYQQPASGNTIIADWLNDLLHIYKAGQSVATIHQLSELLRTHEQSTGQFLDDPRQRQTAVQHVFETLNNALYRQQALQWAASIAQKHNLRFALFGQGWEQHPLFHSCARGPISYGPDLEQLTRSATINLHIVPYNLVHQRLFDGLAAGGFFLIRKHPWDSAIPALAHFIHHNLPPQTNTVRQALTQLDTHQLTTLRDLLEDCRSILDLGDPIEVVRAWQRAQLFTEDHHELLPQFSDIAFDDVSSLERLILHYLHDPPSRHHVASQQRQYIESRFTCEAGMRRALNQIAARLDQPHA